MGLVLPAALASPIPIAVRFVVAVAGTAVLLGAEHGVRGWRLPQTARQIPSMVVARRRPANAWRFAVPYGTGLRTYLPSASPHVLALWLVTTAPTGAVLLGAAAFGGGRGLGLLVRSLSSRRDRYDDVFQGLTARLRPAAPSLVLALTVLAAVLATVRP